MSSKQSKYKQSLDKFLISLRDNPVSPEEFLAKIIMDELAGKTHIRLWRNDLEEGLKNEFGLRLGNYVIDAVKLINVDIKHVYEKVYSSSSSSRIGGLNSGYYEFWIESISEE